jgi:UDPglucose 6-dehydrogenase
MRIAVIGSGYVGLVAAACFADLGHNVVCVDNDADKIEALNSGATPIYEDYLHELLSRHRGRNLAFTTALTEAVRESLVVVIAVGLAGGLYWRRLEPAVKPIFPTSNR